MLQEANLHIEFHSPSLPSCSISSSAAAPYPAASLQKKEADHKFCYLFFPACLDTDSNKNHFLIVLKISCLLCGNVNFVSIVWAALTLFKGCLWSLCSVSSRSGAAAGRGWWRGIRILTCTPGVLHRTTVLFSERRRPYVRKCNNICGCKIATICPQSAVVIGGNSGGRDTRAS